MFTDEAILHGPSPAGMLPGVAFTMVEGGVADFFKALGESLQPRQFELRDFMAKGNKVVVLGYQRGQTKPTGRPYEIEFVHLWSVRDGRFTEFWVFNDKAALIEALSR